MYFTGKTVLCKERVIRSGIQDPKKKVYYISCVGTYRNGNPRKDPFLFDLFTKTFEMQNIAPQVYVVDVRDLLEFYDTFHTTFITVYDGKETRRNLRMKQKRRGYPNSQAIGITIYDLLQFYVQEKALNYEDSHFVLDEVPILPKTGNCRTNL